ncbi:unnamed protein product [Prunus brigantina]
MMFQSVFEGSLSVQDMEVERRPYHKNCTCALHKSKGGVCSNAYPQKRNISFPKKLSWTDDYRSSHVLLFLILQSTLLTFFLHWHSICLYYNISI